MDRVREWIDDLRDHWDDSYWHADHPEVKMTLIAIITGLLGLLFAWLEAKIQVHYRQPRASEM
jgi:hypothetical protein